MNTPSTTRGQPALPAQTRCRLVLITNRAKEKFPMPRNLMQRKAIQKLRQRLQPTMWPLKKQSFPLGSADTTLLLADLRRRQLNLEKQNHRLRESRERLRGAYTRCDKLYNLAPTGYLTQNSTGLIMEANQTLATMLGTDRNRLVQQPITNFIFPEDLENFRQHRQQVLATHQPQSTELRLLQDNGHFFWAKMECLHIGDSHSPNQIQSVISDISAQKIAVDALRNNEALLRLFAEHAPAAVAMVDADSHYLCVSRRWLEVNHLRRAEVVGHSIYESLPHLQPLWADHCQHCLTTGESVSSEEDPIIQPDGSTDWIKWEILPWHDQQGAINGLVVFMEPVTARKEREKKMLQAKKLEAISVLAGGVAHDFNNLLAVIGGNIELAQVELPPTAAAQTSLSRAALAVSRAADLTHKFITFSAGGMPIKKSGAIEMVIKEATTVALSGTNIACEYKFTQPLHQVAIDHDQMRQVFLNLVTNAKEAMPQGGTIRIGGEEIIVDETKKPSSPMLAAGCYIKITLQDDGVGIEATDLPKIFDPYFSTRARGIQKGMGLGLTIVHSIIHKHNGYIEVDSKPGLGTIVTIYLPVTESEAPVHLPEFKQNLSGHRILVLDDEELIRELAQKMLELLGCEVETAATGEEVVRRYAESQNSAHPFQAVILDLTVKGGMGGEEALLLLRLKDPDVRAIVSSGYSMDPTILNATAHGFKSALIKPYTMDELYQAVAAATAT